MKDFVAILVGLAVPVIISYLKNAHWSQPAKLLLALAVCLVFGVIQVVADALATHTAINWGDFPRLAALIFTAATVTYQTYFQYTDLNRALEKSGVGGTA